MSKYDFIFLQECVLIGVLTLNIFSLIFVSTEGPILTLISSPAWAAHQRSTSTPYAGSAEWSCITLISNHKSPDLEP